MSNNTIKSFGITDKPNHIPIFFITPEKINKVLDQGDRVFLMDSKKNLQEIERIENNSIQIKNENDIKTLTHLPDC